MTVHSFPLGDLYPHWRTFNCPCGAFIDDGELDMLVRHNAWTGRDLREDLDRMLIVSAVSHHRRRAMPRTKATA